MRTLLTVLAVGLLATSAFADTKNLGPGDTSTQTVNSAAGNVPTSATDGLSLRGVCGLRATVSAESGQTLSGAGTIKFWYYDTTLATPRWMLNQDLSVNVTSTKRDAVLQDYSVLVGYGRVYLEAVSVTASGGTTLVVRLETVACRSGQ